MHIRGTWTALPAFCLTLALFTGSIVAAGAGEPSFVRGDTNEDGRHDIADPIRLLMALFLETPLGCSDSGDINDDGELKIDDALALLAYLFQSGDPPESPFPTCGEDPTPESLDCTAHGACP